MFLERGNIPKIQGRQIHDLAKVLKILTELSRCFCWFQLIFFLILQFQIDTDPWCNWQHVGFWFRRVLVRAQVGQQESVRV